MAQVLKDYSGFKTKQVAQESPIIIVGNGPIGVRAAKLLLQQKSDVPILIFGDEKVDPYNRVQLSNFLSGRLDIDDLFTPIDSTEDSRVTQYIGKRIVFIDRDAYCIKDDQGNIYEYSKLILATGSTAYVPDVPGQDMLGVLTFRSLADAYRLQRCKQANKRIYVIGSGALGLETAVAMKTPDNEVFIEARKGLLAGQTDAQAYSVLKECILSSGIKIVSKDPVIKLIGNGTVSAVQLTSGKVIECDNVIFCTGIKPNVGLALQAGLATNKGVIVNQYMQTSDPDVYAIGECSEYNGITYGVVAPGLEQAAITANHIQGIRQAYQGSPNNIQVKLGNYSSGFYGELDASDCEVFVFSNRLKGIYRKLLVKKNRVIGFIHIGIWEEAGKVQTYVDKQTKVKPSLFKKFANEGLLWDTSKTSNIRQQPEDYVVCLCENVTRGELTCAMNQGNRTLGTLCDRTGAGTVCGSCKPLLAEMLDTPVPNLVMRHSKSIYTASLLALLLIILTIIFEPLSISPSVQVNWKIEMLWFDNFWKQVSGYTLLGLCALGGALSLRKRFSKFSVGNLDNWRYFHSVVGVLALIILMIHTGLRLGSNLNFVLMAVFLAATLTGSLVGIFMSKSHHWTDLKLREYRKWWSRIHYGLLWLLPTLLTYHIVSVYYY
ncbi:FAD-dependent oxidoreductase [Pleionea sp. CnH1-48]|uniref:FAD-dependent oxidoreductase n=1 Tax=Pleionea sp. CnH1-48 TaxID=2954494 RepID=UPI0020980729|nr:FAD-dependent oxidoreductase [Pleionea sp. CnH1-48]MCO7222797.1 FAD-dependent oxidoreductase [Pleionea sp. CnH1-48]